VSTEAHPAAAWVVRAGCALTDVALEAALRERDDVDDTDLDGLLALAAYTRANGVPAAPTEPQPEPASAVPAIPPVRLAIVPLEEFAGREEASAEPLFGASDETVLAAGGTLLMYGDGGTSKTTLSIDAMAHAAAGIPWLGIEVARPLRVLLVENEGPRGPFRAKLERKLRSWTGRPFAANVFVLEEPWAGFSFANEAHREQLAGHAVEHAIDVLVANPLATLGVEGGGTPDDVRVFDAHLAKFRRLVERPIALWLVHHENKAGDVSGAFERMPDTLVHVRLEGRERSRVHWRKVRWSSSLHNAGWTLRWLPECEGFELIDAEEETATVKAAKLEAATAWIVGYVDEHPGDSRSAVETAFFAEHGKGGRTLARRAIDAQLTASTPLLATGPGRAANGVYLYPASEASSPLAAPLFGEHGEQGSDPEAGPVLASSPPPRRGGERGNGEQTDGVAGGPPRTARSQALLDEAREASPGLEGEPAA
jgi:hypothetical protein